MNGRRLQFPVVCALLAMARAAAAAEPDRDAFLEAWADYMPTTSGTITFESRGDDRYYIEDRDLPYTGEIHVLGALVRPVEAIGESAPFTHMGMVEIKLVDWPAERLQSQNYYYWLADRQTLHFSEADQAWLSPIAYRAAIQDYYQTDVSYGPLSFMLNYGVWILLLALLFWVFATLNKHNRKARALMDDSSSINERARENIDLSAKIQKEAIQISRELLDIQKENQKVLEEIRDRLGQ